MLKWLKDAKRLPQVEAERDQAVQVAANTERAAAEARQNLAVATAKISELEGKVRTQNEADLLLVSMQLVHRLTVGEKKDSPAVMGLLQQQAALQQNVYPYGAYNSGMLGMAGSALSGLWYDQSRAFRQ